MAVQLTPSQEETLRCIRELTERTGVSPTFVELGKALGITRLGARKRVISLARRGYARFEFGLARTLEVLSEGEATVERGNALLIRAITELAIEVEEALAAETTPASRRAVAAARKAREIAKRFATGEVDKLYE